MRTARQDRPLFKLYGGAAAVTIVKWGGWRVTLGRGSPTRRKSLLVPAAATTFQTRDYTIQECGEWFDILAYVEGGVNDQQDVIVLRKS